jgi:hypothetical protein
MLISSDMRQSVASIFMAKDGGSKFLEYTDKHLPDNMVSHLEINVLQGRLKDLKFQKKEQNGRISTAWQLFQLMCR